MIDIHTVSMSEDEKGKRFLELIDEQNSLQWSIIGKLTKLAKSGWDSADAKAELESLVSRHARITEELNSQ